MTITIAELFIKLGLKGADDAKRGLTDVRKTVQDIGSASVEAKLAILGMLATLQHLAEGSTKTGTGLVQFATLTGMNVEALQKWQWAAGKAGVEAGDFQNSLENLQDNMTKMIKLGQAAPAGFGHFVQTVQFDEGKANDPMYVMGKLQQYAKKVKPEVAKLLMETFGLSRPVIASLMEGVYNAKNFKQAPLYSMKESQNLQNIGVAWSELYKKMEMVIGKINEKHGMTMIQDISMLAETLGKVISSLVVLSEKIQLFKLLTTIFEGWNSIFQGWSMLFDTLGDIVDAVAGSDIGKQLSKEAGMTADRAAELMYSAAPEKSEADYAAIRHQPSNTTVNNNTTVNAHVQDGHELVDIVHKKLKGTHKQIINSSPGSKGGY